MLELSLHILDLLQNSLEAGASKIALTIDEDLKRDVLCIAVADNGRGMDDSELARARDPFFTTRSTRRVGLGIPLLAAAAEHCNGGLQIQSKRGEGTIVTATFQHSHIDRAPLGDLTNTLLTVLLGRDDCHLLYRHCVDGRVFGLDTEEVKALLGEIRLSHPSIRRWLQEYLDEGLQALYV